MVSAAPPHVSCSASLVGNEMPESQSCPLGLRQSGGGSGRVSVPGVCGDFPQTDVGRGLGRRRATPLQCGDPTWPPCSVLLARMSWVGWDVVGAKASLFRAGRPRARALGHRRGQALAPDAQGCRPLGVSPPPALWSQRVCGAGAAGPFLQGMLRTSSTRSGQTVEKGEGAGDEPSLLPSPPGP